LDLWLARRILSRHGHDGTEDLAHHRRRPRQGVDIARAALAAGHNVVATGRSPAGVDQHEFWEGQNGRQAGDPAKLAQALLTITAETRRPRRFIAGADAIETAQQRVADLQQQIDAFRDLSTRLAYARIPANA
jgi:hypothetical protein